MRIFFNSRKGTAAVMTAIMMTVLLGFCALVVDIGGVSLERSKLQNAVDSAALAAAQDLPNASAAAATAADYLVNNGFGEAVVNISFSGSNRQITVDASQPVNYAFAGVLGAGSTNVKASATAQKGGKYLDGAFKYAVFSGSRNDELCINSGL